MRSLLAVLIVVGWVAAGCSTASREGKVSTPGPTSPAAAGSRDDYSPEAVAQRTEAHARYALAALYELNEEPEKAAEEFYHAALADRANEPLVLEAAARLMRFKQPEKALDLLKKAAAAPGASGLLHAQMGLVYSLLGRKDDAIAANRAAIKRMPRSLVGYRHLAQLFLQNGQPDEGLKVLDQAARLPDPDATFLTELGEFYLAFARTGPNDQARPRALDSFNRAVKLNPTHPVLLQKLADGFAVLGESDRALELYQKLLERFPTLPGLHEKLADLYLRKQDRAGAAEQLAAIIRLNPTNPQAYYFLGSLAYEEKKMKEAAEHFSKVILLNPGFEPAYHDLAGAQINLNEPRDALATLEKARSRFKPSFVGEFFTALAYSRLKQYTNALPHFTAAEVVARATDTNRLNHVFYFQLGAAYERNKQFDEAEKAFKQCLDLAPDFSEALNYLGYMWAERGVNLVEARALIEKAVKLEPKNAAYLDSLGWVLFKLAQPREALPHLLKAVECSEEPDATIHDHLGDIYSALQQPDKAREAWQKALSLEPAEIKEQIQKKLQAAPPSDHSKPASPPR
jgi:tetratricopeptide (TPR) repeat protein